MATLFLVTNPNKLNAALSLRIDDDAIVTLNFDASSQADSNKVFRLNVNETGHQSHISTAQFIQMCTKYERVLTCS